MITIDTREPYAKVTKLFAELSQKKDKKEEFEYDWGTLSNREFRRKYYRGPWSNL